MPASLDPQLVGYEQQLYKGALVLLPREAGRSNASIAGKILRFQYNPTTITRSRTGEWVDRNQQQSGRAQRSTPAPQSESAASAQGGASLLSKSETISMTLTFDTTEQVLRGGEADASVTAGSTREGMPQEAGVLPMLAALEQLGLGVEQVQTGSSSRSQPRPEPPSEVLLVLGPARQFPVVITSVTITEQRFNAALVPTRADVDVRMRVLEPVDLQYHTWVGDVFGQLVAKRQERLQQLPGATFGPSGGAEANAQLLETLYGASSSLVRTFSDPETQPDPTLPPETDLFDPALDEDDAEFA